MLMPSFSFVLLPLTASAVCPLPTATVLVTNTAVIAASAFFFFCFVYHRDLHSFPTRRSSDLGSDRRSEPRRRPTGSRRGGSACRRAHRVVERSEEHTSELQSRRDLVCRLL